MSDSEIIVRIPLRILDALQKKIIGTSYKSVSEYVQDLVISTVDENSGYTKNEEEEIRRRLNALGYE